MGLFDNILGLGDDSGGGSDQALAFSGGDNDSALPARGGGFGGDNDSALPAPRGGFGGGAPQGMPSASGGGGSGGLLQSVLGLSPQTASRLRAGLGGGFTAAANSWNKPALAAVAAGAGGALTATDKADQQQFTNSLGALDRAIKAKSEGDMNAYRKAMIDYHNASLAEASRYHSGLLERGNYQLIPGSSQDANGATVPGTFKLDTRTGSQDFQPNNIVTTRGGANSQPGQTERLVKQLQQENPNLSTADAIGLTKRAPNGSMEVLRREGLALNAAKADPKYMQDPNGTLEAYRKKYGAGDQQSAPAAPGAPAQQRMPGTPPGMPGAPPAAPQRGASAAKPGEISMQGQGTKTAPYQPSTKDDYDEMPPGSFYLHPSGQVRIKGDPGKRSYAGDASGLTELSAQSRAPAKGFTPMPYDPNRAGTMQMPHTMRSESTENETARRTLRSNPPGSVLGDLINGGDPLRDAIRRGAINTMNSTGDY